MAIRYDDIGDRLKAFRLGSGLSAQELAKRLGISRTALYRFEKGEVVKIETLERLSDLLGVSFATLLGVGVEYISSAVTYFERVRQIEELSEHIVVLAGPISYLLASEAFHETLSDVLKESVPETSPDRDRALTDIDEIMEVLAKRKRDLSRTPPGHRQSYRCTRDRSLSSKRSCRPRRSRRERSRNPPQARTQRGAAFSNYHRRRGYRRSDRCCSGNPAAFGLSIFRQPDREVLALSPFRLGEEPNIRSGIAMITSAPEALSLHQKAVEGMWQRALKGAAAVKFLREILERNA